MSVCLDSPANKNAYGNIVIGLGEVKPNTFFFIHGGEPIENVLCIESLYPIKPAGVLIIAFMH